MKMIKISSSCPYCGTDSDYAYNDFTVMCDLCEREYFLDDWDD